MTGLIFLLILAVFILLVAIYNKTLQQKDILHSLNYKIKELDNTVSNLSKQLKDALNIPGRTIKKEETDKAAPPVVKEMAQPPVTEYIKPPVIKPVTPQLKPEIKVEQETVPATQVHKPVIPSKKEGSWLSTTDMEKFIGENLANKIGIAVLVLGISFFVKYAIDKNWINEMGRVAIGLASGCILIGIAHYIRNSYRSFSSVLVGGGLTVFYFSIAFAFHQYNLIGQTTSFVCMSVITVFAVLLSIFYDRKELAILATIGGFITPFLVSTGSGNYIALFTYICILCTGLMALSWFKRWPVINIIALLFTIIIYGGWLLDRLVFRTGLSFPHKDALLFATLFYLLFIAMNIINNLRLNRQFNAFDFLLVLSINFLYYAAGMIILTLWQGRDQQGIFTASLGIFNLGLAAIFYPRKHIDRNFVSLLIGLALSFISLTAPVQFEGNHIVLFWAAESVVLFWLYQRSRLIHLRLASVLVSLLMCVSLLLSWNKAYFSGSVLIPVFLNNGFITTLTVAVALFIQSILLRKEEPKQIYLTGISNGSWRNMFLVSSLIVAYLAGILEIFYQFNSRFPSTMLYAAYLQAYSCLFTIIVLFAFKRSSYFPLLKFVLTALCFTLYVVNLGTNYQISFDLLTGDKISGGWFMVHWIGAILLGWLLFSLVVYFFRQKQDNWSAYRLPFTWIAAAGILLLLSVELYHVILWTNYRDKGDWVWWENLYYKAGLSILWSICSFTMIWLGMKYGFRTLRIIALTLFTATLLKLFLYDIRNIPPGGKIAAFILLGILLLTVSFMYQRLKKIIIDNEDK